MCKHHKATEYRPSYDMMTFFVSSDPMHQNKTAYCVSVLTHKMKMEDEKQGAALRPLLFVCGLFFSQNEWRHYLLF